MITFVIFVNLVTLFTYCHLSKTKCKSSLKVRLSLLSLLSFSSILSLLTHFVNFVTLVTFCQFCHSCHILSLEQNKTVTDDEMASSLARLI